jgi:hypothetical protein
MEEKAFLQKRAHVFLSYDTIYARSNIELLNPLRRSGKHTYHIYHQL